MTDRLIIGIGNPAKRDDGVGPAVASSMGRLGVATILHDGGLDDLIPQWAGYGRVVLVDVSCSGIAPGTVRVFDANVVKLPAGVFLSQGRGIDLAECISRARKQGLLPAHMAVVTVEGVDFSDGDRLSPSVEAAVPLAMAEVERFL